MLSARFRGLGLALLWAAAVTAQEKAPSGVIWGDLLTVTASPGGGELSLRDAAGHVYQCNFDGKSYFEKFKQRTAATSLERGDHLELISDRKERGGACYVRICSVLSVQPIVPGVRPRAHPAEATRFERLPRTGDMTLTGVITGLQSDRLTLRLRNNEQRSVRLRPDTRYVGDGVVVDRPNLPSNVPVFIRAGHDIENHLEAYQIIWGGILQPDGP